MRAITLGLALLVELAALAAYAAPPLGWDATLGKRLLGAVCSAGLVAFVWAMFAAPKARKRLQPKALVVLKSIIFVGAAAALFVTVGRDLALAFATAATIQMVLAIRTGDV